MFKKEVRDEVDFLQADKHWSGLQVDFNTLGTKVSSKNQALKNTIFLE